MPSERISQIMLFAGLLFAGLAVLTLMGSHNNPNFLVLIISSIVSLGTGTLLMFLVSAKHSLLGYRAFLAFVLVLASTFNAYSLIQPPSIEERTIGHSNFNTPIITLGTFTFKLNRSLSSFTHYYGGFFQAVYSAPYSVEDSRAYTSFGSWIGLRVDHPNDLNGTIFISLGYRPYNVFSSFLRSILINKNTTGFGVDTSYLFPTLFGGGARYDSYELDFDLILDLEGGPTQVNPPQLNFTADFRNMPISISEFVALSNFQNDLAIISSGIFLGLNAYIPMEYLLDHLRKRKRALNPVDETGSEI